MDEPEASAHAGEDGRQSATALVRIRLWTETSSHVHEPVAVDESSATGTSADLSSIATRSRSPPTYLPSTTENGGEETDHANLVNGQVTQIAARFSDRFERSRSLSAKYGLDLNESEWTRPMNEPVQRVERSIRMRIRFWCHQCNTPYGNSRVCSQCSHQRCNRCVRHPPRRTTPRARLADASRTSNALSVRNLHTHSVAEDASTSQDIQIPIIGQAYTNGGHRSPPMAEAFAVSQQGSLQNGTGPEQPFPLHNRTARPSRLRVNHICHECHTTLLPGDSACSGCGDERIKDRPRDPPRRKHQGGRSSNRTLEHPSLTLGSGSDDGEDESETGPTQEVPVTSTQGPRVADTTMSPLCPATLDEIINAGDVDVAPPEPPPPV